MKFCLFIWLLGMCLPHWTTAWRGNREVIIEDGELKSAGRTVFMVDLSNRGIHSLSDSAFDGFSNAKEIDLSRNNLDSFYPRIFSDMGYLERLNMSLNPVTRSLNLKKSHLDGLPLSTSIYLGTDQIFSSEPVNNSFDYDANRPKDWVFPDNDPTYLEEHLEMIICKTVDGLVESVKEVKLDVRLGDCRKAKINSEHSELDLSNLGIRKFGPNWYKVESNGIIRLNLQNNEITDITPELLNNLPSKLTQIDLRWNNITTIKNNTINNKNLEFIMLDDNSISTIEDNAFKNTNLMSITLQRNALTDLDFVKTLPVQLQILVSGYNLFSVISANTFQGLEQLAMIDFTGCQIETIESGAFENSKNLLLIHMGFNRISELKPELFKGLEHLDRVDFSLNRIEKIAAGLFAGFGKTDYTTLLLDHNHINTIEAGSFSNWTSGDLHLEMNRITEKSFAKGVFAGSSISQLNLAGNLIAELEESFLDLPKLSSLNLTRNHIRSIKPGAMKHMSQLRSLDLSQNPLKHLEIGAFHGLKDGQVGDEYYHFLEEVQINLSQVPLEYIKGGVFAEPLEEHEGAK